MRVYLDNCCYNRPFDPQEQTKIRVETECKLPVQALMNRESFDYTEWRRENLFQGETVDSLMDAAEARFGLHD